MKRPIVAVAAVVLSSFIAVQAGLRSNDAEKLLSEGRELMASSKPVEALSVLEKVPGDVRTEAAAKEAAALRIVCLLRAERALDAAKAATDLLAGWSADEPWRGRVESLMASAAAATGDLKKAATVEEALATRLLSNEERARLAETYFTWARTFGAGTPATDALTPAAPPDHGRAIEAYKLGVDALGSKVPRATYRLAIARHAKALNDGRTVVYEAGLALEEWEATKARAAAAPIPAWLAEARLLLAEGRYAAGDKAEARAALRAFFEIPNVDESGFAPKARLLLGRTFVGDPASGALNQAEEAFDAYLAKWPDGEDAAAVRRLRAEACLVVGSLERALPHLAAVLAAPKVSEEDAAWARVRRFETLRALLRFDDARTAVQEYLARHPAHGDVPSAQQLLPTLLMEKAASALGEKRRDDAIATYREFVSTYPLDARAPELSLAIGRELRAAERFAAARDAFKDARALWRVARPDVAATAGYSQGEIEEESLRDLEAAAAAYESVVAEFKGQNGAAHAAARLAALRATELSLSTPRVYAPGEPALVKLAIRNVKETTFRVYKLDALGYFDRKGTLNGAELLDVALVKADRSWSLPTPQFARYRAEEISVPVALGDAPLPEGAYLVAAEAERRRAVVLVVVSKIRVVVKHAPTEIFAWALDAKGGAPMEGVEVLVRGAGLKASAKTGADGVARVAIKPEHGTCEVLARLGDSAAPGLAVAPAPPTNERIEPRAHWTFDRPVYRPGDEVRFSVTLRDVEGGAFTTPFDHDVEVAWIDPLGRTFSSLELKTERFGRCNGSFRLPNDGALGDWKLRATLKRAEGVMRTFDGTVVVSEYRKPEFKVSVRPKNATVRPGGRVEVALAVEAFFGGAAPRVDYRWRAFRRAATFDDSRYREQAWIYRATESQKTPTPDAEWEFVAEGVGVADEKGLAEWSFDSVDMTAAQEYLVQASVVDASKQWSTGSGFAYASWTPGNVVVIPDRKAYRAGDRLSARILGLDWSGAPLPLRGEAEVVIVREEGGRRVEEPMTSASTDLGDAGEAEVRLDLPKAGRVLVRFTGETAAGLKVVGEAGAEVAGERPDLAKEAKILFEKEIYRAGEKARIFVNVPKAPAKGLLAFEGETVLMHRVVDVTESSSTIEIELPEALAPNCVATWTSVHEHGLLTSEDPLVVLRHLDVTITPSQDVARPGETVKLAVTVRDQAGRPVEAGVAISLSDGALDGLGGLGPQDPRFTFNRDVRSHLVRTGSSFAFRRDAKAAFLDDDLVALGEHAERMNAAARFGEEFRRDQDRFARPESVDALERARKPAEASGDAIGVGGGAGGAFGGRRGGRRNVQSSGGGGMVGKEKSDELAKDAKKLLDRIDAGWGPPAADPAASALRSLSGSTGVFYTNDSAQDLRGRTETLLDGVPDNVTFGGYVDLSDKNGLPSINAVRELSAALPLSHSGFLPKKSTAVGERPAPVEMRRSLLDVAAWAPSVVTDSEGRAEIEATLPDNLTVWSATATAVDVGVAAGLARGAVMARKDVFVRLAAPPFATEGDVFAAFVAGARTNDRKARMKLTLRAVDPRVAVIEGAAEIEKDDVLGAAFEARVVAKSPGFASFESRALCEDASDGLSTTLTVSPFGEPWRVVERRTLRDRTSVVFEIPEGTTPGTLQTVVVVQAGLASELLEGLAFLQSYPFATLDAIVHRVVAAAVVRKACLDAGLPSIVDEADMRRAAASLFTTMRGYQNADLGFASWPGRPSEPEATALALSALVRLSEAGRPAGGDLFSTAILGAMNQLSRPNLGRDQRAALVEALTLAGVDRGADLNALYRERESLATASIARVLIASVAARRTATVEDLLATLRSRRTPGGDGVVVVPRDPWLGDVEETTALMLLAYQAANARVGEQQELADALRSRRRIRGCVAPRPVATAALALARHMKGVGAIDVAGSVTATFDGKDVGSKKLDGAAPRTTFDVDPALLLPGRHELVLSRSGGGEVDVRLIASGFVPKDAVAADGGFFAIDRRVVPYEDPDRPAESFAEGFSIVVEGKRPPYEPPAPLKQAVAGTRATVRLVIRAREAASHVVVEDPLPAGFDVVESGVRGPFSRFERRANRMVFFFDRCSKGKDVVVTYPVYATLPGKYRAMPAEAFELHEPETRGRGASYAFEVISDPARMERVVPPAPTPDARLAAAKKAFAAEEYERVLDVLGDLATAFPLADDFHDVVLDLTRRAALRAGRHDVAVRAHDALVLRNSSIGRLSLEDDRLLGLAFLGIGEPERASDRFRRVIDDGFAAEQAVANYVEGVGRTLDAAEYLSVALLRRPMRGGVVGAALVNAGLWLDITDPKATGVSAAPLQTKMWARALTDYQRLQAWMPGSAVAERAAHERIMIFAGLGLPQRVRDEARATVARFPESNRLDELLAAEAQASFALGDYKDAARPAERVRTGLFPPTAETKARSGFAEAMAYLLGRIAHVEGRLSDAVALYGEAASRVPEAGESFAFFTRKELVADAVVRVRPGAAAKLPMRVKNVAKVSVALYPVDLGVLFATRKSFDALNRADLSGIAPAKAFAFETGVEPFESGTTAATIDGGLATGAYLAVVGDGERVTTSVVLSSDLDFAVQRGDGDVVRCYLVDAAGKPAAGAKITVGVGGSVRFAGVTDERGMLHVSVGAVGPTTLIAELGDRYAAAEL